jgi:hypothetical protein
VRTYLEVTKQNRRLEKLNAEAASTNGEMRRHNLTLRLEYSNGHERWSLSDGRRVDRDVAQHMLAGGGLVADDDALFPHALKQTYRARNVLNQLKDLHI